VASLLLGLRFRAGGGHYFIGFTIGRSWEHGASRGEGAQSSGPPASNPFIARTARG
jgi:hypothetical protein